MQKFSNNYTKKNKSGRDDSASVPITLTTLALCTATQRRCGKYEKEDTSPAAPIFRLQVP